jgi:hypothetical protein
MVRSILIERRGLPTTRDKETGARAGPEIVRERAALAPNVLRLTISLRDEVVSGGSSKLLVSTSWI